MKTPVAWRSIAQARCSSTASGLCGMYHNSPGHAKHGCYNCTSFTRSCSGKYYHTCMLISDHLCGKLCMVIQMLIDSVVKNEAIRNRQMIEQYETMLQELPKGSLICRKKTYYYLKYRKEGKLYDEYVGKDANTVSDIREKIAKRKHCEQMLSVLRQEQKKISRILEGLE